MSSAATQAAALFRNLDAPEILTARAQETVFPLPLRVNAHIHLPPNFSAFDTVEQAVGLAAAQDVRVVGVSNYYDYAVYADFIQDAERAGIFPLFGLEIIALLDDLARDGIKINDPGNPGKMYICGKGITRFDPMTPEAAELLATIRRNDGERMARMTDRLAHCFAAAGLDTGLDEEAVKTRIVQRHGCPRETVYLQERHVAQAFQEVLFERKPAAERQTILEKAFGTAYTADPEDVARLQNAIRSHLMKAGKPAYVPETFVGFDHAYRLILALGGIPCYPTLADGVSPICPYEDPVEELIARIRERSIFCAEFIPTRNQPDVLARYVRAMRQAGLVVTAGTEHNTREMLPIEPTCVNGQPIPEDIRDIFREGACVLAAHQYRTLYGQPGFVDGQGHPDPAYANAEDRIAAYRALGAAVIAQYQERHALQP